jgi:uncharacterized membrane protein YoaK (UPF0700 family)
MLSAAGGFLDGFSYVGHGQVFANAMTGNVVLFGASCFMGTWQKALLYLPPILAFLAAIWASRAMHVFWKRRAMAPAHTGILLFEIAALGVLSCLPATTVDVLFTTSTAFVATLQIQTFREVNGRAYSSTFTTGNLRTLGEAAFMWLFEGRAPETKRVMRDFAVIVSSFLLGAVGGGAATKAFGNHALWWDMGLLVVVVIRLRAGTSVPHSRHEVVGHP